MIADRVHPATVEELARTLAEADRNGARVAIEGGGTLRGMGNPATGAALAVGTANLRELIAHEYHDLTCAVQSGMTLADLSAQLSEHGQFVPLDAPLRKRATVGGTMAAGWLGPRRHFYGRARDFAIGTEAVLPDGTVARAGGMVVKNVSGYDMSKVYIGSFGTLAALTQINFKTLPVPAKSRALVARLPERTRARAVAQIAALGIAPAAALCVEGFRKEIDGEDGVDGRVIVLLEGSEALLDRATRDLRSALGRAGIPETIVVDAGSNECLERVLDAQVSVLGERSVTYRSLGTPESVESRAAALRDAANRCELFTDVLFDVMNGDVYLRVSERDSRAFASKIEGCDDALRAIDGRSIIVAGDAPIRASLQAWGALPPAFEKMRALKTRFDPNGTLNPGRFIGGI